MSDLNALWVQYIAFLNNTDIYAIIFFSGLIIFFYFTLKIFIENIKWKTFINSFEISQFLETFKEKIQKKKLQFDNIEKKQINSLEENLKTEISKWRESEDEKYEENLEEERQLKKKLIDQLKVFEYHKRNSLKEQYEKWRVVFKELKKNLEEKL